MPDLLVLSVALSACWVSLFRMLRELNVEGNQLIGMPMGALRLRSLSRIKVRSLIQITLYPLTVLHQLTTSFPLNAIIGCLSKVKLNNCGIPVNNLM